MRVLAIETSCDENSVSVVENGIKIRSNIICSQEKIHKKFFGVVPELASREHLKKINFAIHKALVDAGIFNYSKDIDLIAYTRGPGLIGSLLIGQTVAQTLSYIWKKPILGINHLEGHIYSIFLNHNIKPPFLALIVSGGHTEILIMEDFGKYKFLGSTLDDAAGECFDKVAKMLKLGYPGGPLIEKYASKGNKNINFPRPYLKNTYNFSFSGLKTAVLYYLQKNKNYNIEDVCASFQQAVCDVLVYKTKYAIEHSGLKKIVVCGGVAANNYLRKLFKERTKIKVFFPQKTFCTDNAAMIGACAFFKYKKGYTDSVEIDPSLKISSWLK